MTGPGSDRATESSPSCPSSDARQKGAPVAGDDHQGSVPFERTTAPHDGLNMGSADPTAGSSSQHRPRLDPRAVGSHSIVEGEPSTAQQAMMRGLARQLSSAARYKQVRSRRQQFTSGEGGGACSQRGASEVENAGSGGGGGHESEGLFLYDFVCTDVDEGVAAKEAKAERRKAAQERMKRVAEEGAILMNYLPMVRSLGAVLVYFLSHPCYPCILFAQSFPPLAYPVALSHLKSYFQIPVLLPSLLQVDQYLEEAGLKSELKDQGQQLSHPAQAEAAMDIREEDEDKNKDEDEDDFVYDVYLAVEDREGDAQDVPVVEVSRRGMSGDQKGKSFKVVPQTGCRSCIATPVHGLQFIMQMLLLLSLLTTAIYDP